MANIIVGITTIADKTVATAGTAERLVASSLEVIQVVIQWHPSNTGNVYIGDSSVAAGRGLVLSSSNPTVSLSAEDSLADEDRVMMDLTDIWVDTATNGNKVKIMYIAVTRKVY